MQLCPVYRAQDLLFSGLVSDQAHPGIGAPVWLWVYEWSGLQMIGTILKSKRIYLWQYQSLSRSKT